MKITTEQLQATLGGSHILKGVSIEVSDKDFVGIIGPNGSGKSTLLKSIYRVLTPQSGTVFLDGNALNSYKPKESARKMAVVAQHNYYNFEFSVQDVVLMGRAPHKKAMERDNADDYRIVREALEKVNMAALPQRSFSTLSGGEQQPGDPGPRAGPADPMPDFRRTDQPPGYQVSAAVNGHCPFPASDRGLGHSRFKHRGDVLQ